MSFEFTGDPYAVQLRAAKAEGELARIKDELREFAEENGLNPEMEPRDLLAKAAGAFHSCAAMSDARYTEIQELRADMEAMRPRLMPEGMEWPCFDDGEPVRIGDEYADTFGANTVATIEFGDGYSAINPNTPGGYVVGKFEGAHGRCVPRPAPKVLDADGVEIRVGDVLYRKSDGRMAKVVNVYKKTFTDADDYVRPGDGYTHRAPVLAADGLPLREGETVWSVDSGTRYTVEKNTDELIPIKCRSEMGTTVSLHPSQLTHERLDSWERIEADCMQDAKDYCEEHGIEPEYPKHIGKAKCEDLVRRAKKLAGVE